MLNKFFSTSIIKSIIPWGILIVVGAFCLWLIHFMHFKYIEWQNWASILNVKDRIEAESDSLATIAQIFGGLFLLIGLYFTGWNSWIARKSMEIAQRNMEIAHKNTKIMEDGKITDRFSKAVEQLGSEKLEIRLGGIYAFERIAVDSEKDWGQVKAILAAFARENSFQREKKEKIDADIQAVLTVISHLNNRYKTGRLLKTLDLSKAYLPNADIMFGHLEVAWLEGACLQGAELTGAQLEQAWLNDADLEGANLSSTNLKKAFLVGANLKGACLNDANLERANLEKANLERASFLDVNLKGANLEGAHLKDAESLSINQLSTVCTLYNIDGLDSDLREQVQANYPHLLKKPELEDSYLSNFNKK